MFIPVGPQKLSAKSGDARKTCALWLGAQLRRSAAPDTCCAAQAATKSGYLKEVVHRRMDASLSFFAAANLCVLFLFTPAPCDKVLPKSSPLPN